MINPETLTDILERVIRLLEDAKTAERMKDIPILIDDAINLIDLIILANVLNANLIPLDNE